MQQILFIDLFIDLFESVLHVSGYKLAHLQEHFLTVYTALVQFTDIAADGQQYLVGCIHRCSNDARSQKRQMLCRY